MNFIQGLVTKENMWINLERILDNVDADFTGANGEEYYAENNKSHMENAIKESEKYSSIKARITYVIVKCKEYSENFYDDFNFTVIKTIEGYEVVIAVA